MTRSRPGPLLIPLGLALLAAAVHLPVLDNAFVNFDDVFTILNNPLIQGLDAAHLRDMFGGFYFGNYQPLTWLSLAASHALAGPDPRFFHAVNLLLHCLNTVLAYFFVMRLAARGGDEARVRTVALIAGALFAVHTLHVESVAWASQRKDLLFTAFYLGSLLLYLRHADGGARRHYLLALALFLCSLLAKAAAAPLFAVVVALDHHRGRLRGPGLHAVLLEKLPFAALGLGFGALAVVAQRSSDFVAHAALHTPLQRLLLACWGFTLYLAKLALPLRLSAYYPYPDLAGGLPAGLLFAPLVAALFVVVMIAGLRRRGLAAFGLLFFALNIGPLLQLLPIGDFLMADRFAYLPSLGVFLAVGAAGVALVRSRPKLGRPLGAALLVWVVLLSGLTVRRADVWQDSLTLWNDVLAQHPDIALALSNRGTARGEAGDLAGAVADFDRALAVDPGYVDALDNRGYARLLAGDSEGALTDFDLALRRSPGNPGALAHRAQARFQRGVARYRAGDFAGAAADFAAVLRDAPDFPGARRNLEAARRLSSSPPTP